MKLVSYAATLLIALTGFTTALPSADANAVSNAEGAMAEMFKLEARQCRRLGARCTRDRQCCSRECDDGRCERDD
jgi:hypothetical protein